MAGDRWCWCLWSDFKDMKDCSHWNHPFRFSHRITRIRQSQCFCDLYIEAQRQCHFSPSRSWTRYAISVTKLGDRMDDPGTVHQINVLTVVANQSWVCRRPAKWNQWFPFCSTTRRWWGLLHRQSIKTSGDVEVTPALAKQIYRYLLKNDYTDEHDHVAQAYHDAKEGGTLSELPPELAPHASKSSS